VLHRQTECLAEVGLSVWLQESLLWGTNITLVLVASLREVLLPRAAQGMACSMGSGKKKVDSSSSDSY